MHIENDIFPSSFAYLQIIYDETTVQRPGMFYRVSYVRELTDGSFLRFRNNEDEAYDIAFSFRKYIPFDGGITLEQVGSPSGAYIFKPDSENARPK